MPITLQQLTSDISIDMAFIDLCQRYQDKTASNWHLRFYWSTLKPQIQKQRRERDYRSSPYSSINISNHRAEATCAYAENTLALKVLTTQSTSVITVIQQLSAYQWPWRLNKTVMRAKENVRPYP